VTLEALLAAASGVSTAAALTELLAAPRRQKRRRGALMRLVANVGAAINVRAANGLAQRVAAAGLDREVAEIVALQAGLALIGSLIALPFVTTAPGRLGLALIVAVPFAGYFAPEYALRKRIQHRAKRMAQELPDVLDLLRVAVQAGLSPRRALSEVGRRHPGVLAGELRRAAARAELGETADDTLSHLETRCPAAGIAPFVAALRRAERHGAPLGPTLAAQAEEARSRRAAHRAEQAAKAAPKIQLVVALLLVPAVLLLVAAALVPALAGA
jgi:tight adherence protein C